MVIALLAFAITDFTTAALKGNVVTDGGGGSGGRSDSGGGGSDGGSGGGTNPRGEDDSHGSDNPDDSGGNQGKTTVTLAVSNGSETLIIGDTARVKASISPRTIKNIIESWDSQDESIAKVDNRGVITAVGVGTTTIIGTTTQGDTGKINITVRELIKPTAIAFDKKSIKIKTNENVATKIIFTPENTEVTDLSYKSNDTKIATVTDSGSVTGKTPGKTKIVATTVNGKTATLEVTVEAASNVPATKFCNAETGRGLCKATKISINFNPSSRGFKEAAGRCGNRSGDSCRSIATVTYPGATVKYYMRSQNDNLMCGGSCRLNAFTAAMNAVNNTKIPGQDVLKYIKSTFPNEGNPCLRGKRQFRAVFSHFKVKGKMYFGEKSSGELKRLAKIALDNGQPVSIFVAHDTCPQLAGSHHALLLLGYDKNTGKTQFVESSGYSASQSGKWTINQLFDRCLSSSGIRNDWMGMQIYEF